MLNRIRDEKGFTLIELLVVILIIAILLAVAAPSFLGQQDKAKNSGMKQQLSVLYKAAKADAVDNPVQGQYSTGAALVAALTDSEPQLASALTTSTSPGATGSIAVGSTDSDTFVAVGHSESGDIITLTVENNGAPVVTGG